MPFFNLDECNMDDFYNDPETCLLFYDCVEPEVRSQILREFQHRGLDFYVMFQEFHGYPVPDLEDGSFEDYPPVPTGKTFDAPWTPKSIVLELPSRKVVDHSIGCYTSPKRWLEEEDDFEEFEPLVVSDTLSKNHTDMVIDIPSTLLMTGTRSRVRQITCRSKLSTST